MANLVVYTTVIGRTDPLREPLCPGNTQFVCFTDKPLQSKHWEIRRVPECDNPNRHHHMYKQLSHIALGEANATLWVDAAFLLRVNPQDILAAATHDVMGFKHPDRTRISQEALAIIKAGKGRKAGTMAQLHAYRADGWDTNEDPQQYITNGGFLLRKNTPAVNTFNEFWNNEVQHRTLRDQMSIDYSAHKCGVTIGHFSGTVRANKFATLQVLRNKQVTDF